MAKKKESSGMGLWPKKGEGLWSGGVKTTSSGKKRKSKRKSHS